MQEFCAESSIHGVQYLAPLQSVFRRFLWTGLLVGATILSTIVIQDLVDNWNTSPTFTSVHEQNYPIQNLPFPAVTVCPKEYDIWNFIQKVGDAVEPSKEFLDENWKTLEAIWIRFQGLMAIKFHMHDKDQTSIDTLHSNLGNHCISLLSDFRCITGWMYLQLAKKNPSKAMSMKWEIPKQASKEYFPVGSNYFQLLQEVAYPILKQALQDEGVDCPLCYSKFSNGLPQFENKTLAEDIAHSLFRSMSSDSDNNTFYLSYKTELTQLNDLNDRIIAVKSVSLEEVGSAISMAYSTEENPFVLRVIETLAEQKINVTMKIKDGRTVDLTMKEWLQSLGGNNQRFNFNRDHFLPPIKGVALSAALNWKLLKAIFVIMKENMFQPHLLDLDLIHSSKFSPYLYDMGLEYPSYLTENLTGYPLREIQSLKQIANSEAFLPFCQWQGKWSDVPKWGTVTSAYFYEEICTLFKPALTDMGICYSFNAMDSDFFLKTDDSEYMKAYGDVFEISSSSTYSQMGKGRLKAAGIGIKNGLRIVLDAHTLKGSNKKQAKTDNTFQLALHHPKDFGLPLIQGIEVQGGTRVSIIVDAESGIATERVKGLPPAQRGCKLTSELTNADESMFARYDTNGCLFECMYEHAHQSCGCIPWNYPQKVLNVTVPCNYEGRVCFDNALKDGDVFKTCQCPTECDQVSYTYYSLREKLDPHDCELQSDKTMKKISDYISAYQVPNRFFWNIYNRWYSEFDYGGDSERYFIYPRSDCKSRLSKDIAIVDIYFGSQFAKKYQKDVTATFTDKLASIGGTLGLFCGISILSVVEILLFFCKMATKCYN